MRRTLKILAYHELAASDKRAGRDALSVAAFERQMRWVRRARYQVVSLEEAVARCRAGDPLPRRAVALTFDDGTQDVLTLAYPILKRYGFPATVFIVTEAMGGSTDWNAEGAPILTWAEAMSLEPLIQLQPHTRTHRRLPTLSNAALWDELCGSREDIENHTQREATLFAYPYGARDARVVEAVAAAGFTAACTIGSGDNHDDTPLLELRRFSVRGGEGFHRFAAFALSDRTRRRLSSLLDDDKKSTCRPVFLPRKAIAPPESSFDVVARTAEAVPKRTHHLGRNSTPSRRRDRPANVAHAPESNLDMLAWFSADERQACSRCGEPAAVTLPNVVATFCLECGATTIDDVPIGLRPELEILAR